jgi:hypothetical protein
MIYISLIKSVYRTEDVVGYLYYLKGTTPLSKTEPVTADSAFVNNILAKRNEIATFQHNCKGHVAESKDIMGVIEKYKKREKKYPKWII